MIRYVIFGDHVISRIVLGVSYLFILCDHGMCYFVRSCDHGMNCCVLFRVIMACIILCDHCSCYPE